MHYIGVFGTAVSSQSTSSSQSHYLSEDGQNVARRLLAHGIAMTQYFFDFVKKCGYVVGESSFSESRCRPNPIGSQ